MSEEGVARIKRIIFAYVIVSGLLLILLGYYLAQTTVVHHRVGPAEVTLLPGEWIELPMHNQMDYYTITFRLEVECSETLDMVVMHETWGFDDMHRYNRSLDRPERSAALSSGTWNERLEGLCDCGMLMIIDHTDAGNTTASDGPVNVRYTLDWNEHTSVDWQYSFYAIIGIAIALPCVLVFLNRKLMMEKAAM